jgi:C4-dicarboxylate-specific signal transduction histidine kinase
MDTIENPAVRSVADLMSAITEALKATAAKSSERLRKPEVVAAMLKVLHSVVASKEGPADAKKVEEIGKAISGTFYDDIDAIRAFVDDKANGLV